MRRSPALALACLVACALACASPVGVERQDPRKVRAQLAANVLAAGELSHDTELVLQAVGVSAENDRQLVHSLDALHALLPTAPHPPDVLYALAELSFLHGDREGGASAYAAAAVYAWAFLFPEDPADRPSVLDPRTRVAADLYNRGLARGLREAEAEVADLSSRTVTLSFGTLVVTSPKDPVWAGHRLVDLVPADDYEIRGIRNRYRRPGIGAPFIAGLERLPGSAAREAARIPKAIHVPVTVLLRFDDALAGLQRGELSGRLELYAMEEVSTTEIHGEEVPLEYEPSVAFALGVGQSEVWSIEIESLFQDRVTVMSEDSDGLFMIHPYRPGQIPVVLVHGTASSPGRWAEVVNELTGDPVLRDRVVPWLFVYATGNPILLSAGRLRAALQGARRELDPEAKDAALQHMVLVGHSQGGLLVRLQVTDSETAFWDAISEEPVESLDLDPATQKWLEDQFFFEALPFADRVVFMATPHRGSFRATDGVAALAGRLISLPVRATQATVDLISGDSEAKLRSRMRQVPTSIENMRPGSLFMDTLASRPLAEGVTAHSIIAVPDPDGGLEDADDGVVKYESATLSEAASEVIVPSHHSMQAHPETIAELKRILREQVAAFDAARSQAAAEAAPPALPEAAPSVVPEAALSVDPALPPAGDTRH